MSIHLEKYDGGRGRHACPQCGHAKQFTRWLDERGQPFADNVDICNRKTKCGYSYTPKEFFRDNPKSEIGQIGHNKKAKIQEYHGNA